MRALCLVVLLALAGTTLGCDDDTTNHSGDLGAGTDDLGIGGGGTDLQGRDLLTCNRMFNGFNGVQTSLATFECTCGCVVDGMESSVVNPMWGATKTANSNSAPISGVAL